MKKMLLIGPDFFNYNFLIATSFKKNGYDVDIINYLDNRNISFLHGVVNYIFKSDYKINPNSIKINKFYDFIFVIKGTKLNEKTLILLKKKCKKMFLWFMDPLSQYPEIKLTLKYFDHVFMFQYKDVILLNKKLNLNVTYLPLFHVNNDIDDLKNVEKKIDIIFIGNLYNGRAELLDFFLKNLEKKDYNIHIYGGFGFFKLFEYFKIKTKYKYLSKYLKFGLVSQKKMMKLYKMSKCSLNIHPDDQSGLNMRFFELYGAHVYQFLIGNDLDIDYIDIDKCAYKYIDFKNHIDFKNSESLIYLNKNYNLSCFNKIMKHNIDNRVKFIMGFV